MDYLNQADRKQKIDEIVDSNENKLRKNTSLMQYEIYKKRQHPFVVNKIRAELGPKAANNSRIISSINLTPKIIDEQSKVYQKPPVRTFTGLTEAQEEHVNKIYELGKANIKLKKSNKIYKLQSQGALQIVPKDGIIEFRPLYLHQYDVIPYANDPEKAEAYVISSYDKQQLFQTTSGTSGLDPVTNRGYSSDSVNQGIADPNDYKNKMCFYWWTKDYNFVTNFQGVILDHETLEPLKTFTDKDIENPIKELPFIDIAADKDFEFFVRAGNSTVDFTLDFAAMLSDQSEIARLQGFAQAVLSSVEEPRELHIGPRNYLWLKKDPKGEASTQPTFGFASPNPDISATNEMNANFLSMFLTSVGLSPKIINSKGEKEQYASGIDRYLAMLERFEASIDDYDLFQFVEKKVYQLIVKWNNVYANATENGFVKELSSTSLPESSEVTVNFYGPERNLSDSEKLMSYEKKMELGLMSRVQAIMEDRGIEEPAAIEVMQEIDRQQMITTSETTTDQKEDANTEELN
jgi:hypothetical protein